MKRCGLKVWPIMPLNLLKLGNKSKISLIIYIELS